MNGQSLGAKFAVPGEPPTDLAVCPGRAV